MENVKIEYLIEIEMRKFYKKGRKFEKFQNIYIGKKEENLKIEIIKVLLF